jgi:hypothetical protein
MIPVWTLVVFSEGRVVGLATYAARKDAMEAARQLNTLHRAELWESPIIGLPVLDEMLDFANAIAEPAGTT